MSLATDQEAYLAASKTGTTVHALVQAAAGVNSMHQLPQSLVPHPSSPLVPLPHPVLLLLQVLEALVLQVQAILDFHQTLGHRQHPCLKSPCFPVLNHRLVQRAELLEAEQAVPPELEVVAVLVALVPQPGTPR